MAYERTTWVNDETVLDQDRLNNMEQELVTLDEKCTELSNSLAESFVVESNTDDYYCDYEKCPNGKLIINQIIYIESAEITNISGSIYYAIIDLSSYTFPVAFTSRPVVQYGTVSDGTNAWAWQNSTRPNTTNPGHVSIGRGSSTTGSIRITVHAEGQWK